MQTLRLTGLMYSVQSPPVGNAGVASVSTNVIPAGYTAIYTVEDLKNIENNASGKYILMKDIDLSSVDDWNPLCGKLATGFSGTFDGNGHVIKNLKSTQGGLFGYTYNATIKNVGLKNEKINSDKLTQIGGLANRIQGTSISNCYVEGDITNNSTATSATYGYAIGGLVGSVGTGGSHISNCYYSGNITTKSINIHSGGLIGSIQGNSTHSSLAISDCFTSGKINGASITGGLIGFFSTLQYDISLTNCFTTCDVIGTEVIMSGIPKFTPAGLLTGTIPSEDITFENVFGNADKSTIKAVFGENPTITPPDFSDYTEDETPRALSNSQFNSAATWTGFSDDIWDKSTFPPKLKNMPGSKTYNFSASNEFRLQVGEGADESANAIFVDTGINLDALNIDLSTTDDCLEAIDCIKAALDAVTQKASDIGVAQSRLETISNVNTTKIENLTAAYSTVTAADEAEEVANFTKSQIMAQTAASLITQTQAFQANLLLRMIGSLG